ncbi:sugar transferase, partial [Arthrospira platensis SPKY2]
MAATALLAVSPLLLIALIGIKLTSPGPVFYKAKRVGMGGANFSMLKFRTMHVGSDRQSAITAPDDRRVFRFGRILRQLKIDELPQFWNILSGDMS